MMRRSSFISFHSLLLVVAVVLLLTLPTVTLAYNNNNDNNEQALTTSQTFDQYVQEFGKIYSTTEEREERKAIFEANYHRILQHNQRITLLKDKEPSSTEGVQEATSASHWVASWNEWTDRKIPEELPLGYVKKSSRTVSGGDETVNFLTQEQQSSEAEKFLQDWMDHTVVPVSELPKEVDWRTHSNPKVTTVVRQQGFCGSCWAVAASSVLESHIALATGQLYRLSPQEMVSCVQNKQHCGGDGGCGGATYELAFEYVMQHGIVSEEVFPYKSATGRSIQCSLKNHSSDVSSSSMLLRGSSGNANTDISSNANGYIDGAVATIQGYVNFPTNNYTVLMNAVANLGPIGVTVAASEWAFYSSGVFHPGKDHNTSRATDVNHAVVLEGYGVDQETQEPYWLVRNSWGKHWGEGGYIRLKRVDPSTVEDWEQTDCGVDMKPADGAGCTKDEDGNTIVPPPVKVCGTSTILYDTFVPFGGRLLQQQEKSELEMIM